MDERRVEKLTEQIMRGMGQRDRGWYRMRGIVGHWLRNDVRADADNTEIVRAWQAYADEMAARL